jgi:hypothetical protein
MPVRTRANPSWEPHGPDATRAIARKSKQGRQPHHASETLERAGTEIPADDGRPSKTSSTKVKESNKERPHSTIRVSHPAKRGRKRKVDALEARILEEPAKKPRVDNTANEVDGDEGDEPNAALIDTIRNIQTSDQGFGNSRTRKGRQAPTVIRPDDQDGYEHSQSHEENQPLVNLPIPLQEDIEANSADGDSGHGKEESANSKSGGYQTRSRTASKHQGQRTSKTPSSKSLRKPKNKVAKQDGALAMSRPTQNKEDAPRGVLEANDDSDEEGDERNDNDVDDDDDESPDTSFKFEPPVTHPQFTDIEPTYLKGMMTKMGKNGWAGHGQKWKEELTDGQPKTNPAKALWKSMQDLWTKMKEIPAVSETDEQNLYLQANHQRLTELIRATGKRVHKICKKAAAGKSKSRMSLIDDFARYIIPMLVLMTETAFLTGSDDKELPLVGGCQFSSAMMQLLMRLDGWIRRLALIVDGSIEVEGRAGARASVRLQLKKLVEQFDTQLRDSLEELQQRELHPLRIQQAKEKDAIVKAYRAERQRRVEEERDTKLQRLREALERARPDAFGRVTVEIARTSPSPEPEREPVVVRSPSLSMRHFPEEPPVRNSRMAKVPAWTLDESEILFNMLQSVNSPDLSVIALELGRNTEDVFCQVDDIKWAVRKTAFETGKQTPRWATKDVSA